MQQYIDCLGSWDSCIAELTVTNSEITKEKDLLDKEVADLAVNVQEAEATKDAAIKEKVATEEVNLRLIT